MKNEELRKDIDILISLVEDNNFPARRNILDYVTQVISKFDYKVAREADKYIEKRLKEIDKKKAL